ncbi:hypothetical protein ACUW6W_001947 [Micrococcus sp. 093350064-1]|nr:hypothetical protein CYJ93_08410 [Micrococcus luteus]
MMTDMKKGRPATDGAAPTTKLATPILLDPETMLEGVLVLVVAHAEAGETRYRRRVFYTVAAAQRAADRAVERGHAASITLCRLAPVTTLAEGWKA